MAKYLFSGSYSESGLKGLLQEGGSGRREAVQQMMESLGGSLESIYWAFGSDDFLVIADLPDNEAAAAGALIVAAGGSSRPRTTVLLTAEEIDEAAKRSAKFRAPGE